jgi:hypothetical protein
MHTNYTHPPQKNDVGENTVHLELASVATQFVHRCSVLDHCVTREDPPSNFLMLVNCLAQSIKILKYYLSRTLNVLFKC